MHESIRSAADIYAFNNRLVHLALADLSDADAGHRFRGGNGSSIHFLAGHLLSSRYGLLKRFGRADDNPYAELFGGGDEARASSEYPPLAEVLDDWDAVGGRLLEAFAALDEDQILAEVAEYPIDDKTVRGAIMFLAWHESYHVGQIGGFRTELGYSSVQARLYEAMQAESGE